MEEISQEHLFLFLKYSNCPSPSGPIGTHLAEHLHFNWQYDIETFLENFSDYTIPLASPRIIFIFCEQKNVGDQFLKICGFHFG